MRNRGEVNIRNVYEGMRIKVSLPTLWLGIKNANKPYTWLKGKVCKVYNRNGEVKGIYFSLRLKRHRYLKIDNMEAYPSKDGIFTSIFKCM